MAKRMSLGYPEAMRMITPAEVDTIAAAAARANLSANAVLRVFSEPTLDSEGKDALHLTIVVAPEAVDALEGDALLDTLVQIQRDLQKAGEDRFAIVEYATEAELGPNGDP